MNSPKAPSLSFSSRSTSDYDSIPSEPQILFNQLPALAPPQVSAQPLISTCDKSSIQEISEKLQSLNSSISDAVDAIMEKKLKPRKIALRSGRHVKGFSRLIQLAIEECARTKNKDRDVRNKFQNAILHDHIIGFIYDLIEGSWMGGISSDYEKFRLDIEKVRETESFVDAQNWIRIAAKLVVAPPDKTWQTLANVLMREIDSLFWRIGGIKPEARLRIAVDRNMGKQHLSAIIKFAFDLSMEIRSGILSQRLELTVPMKQSPADPGLVEMGESLARVTSVQPESGSTDYFILGIRSFGLTAEFEDGTRKIYLKPVVDYS